MTRSHKANDRDHKGLADGTAAPMEHLPRFFAKSGHVDVDPKKVKKNGCGRANWGQPGEELDDEGIRVYGARRRSNSFSFSHHITDFKTKWDANDPDVVYEEAIHGPLPDEETGEDLSKTDSSDSGRSMS